MVTYINIDEAIDNLCEDCFMRNCSHDCDVVKAIRKTKPADVLSVSDVSKSVDAAIDYLNDTSLDMPYYLYSNLHDLIKSIGKEKSCDDEQFAVV